MSHSPPDCEQRSEAGNKSTQFVYRDFSSESERQQQQKDLNPAERHLYPSTLAGCLLYTDIITVQQPSASFVQLPLLLHQLTAVCAFVCVLNVIMETGTNLEEDINRTKREDKLGITLITDRDIRAQWISMTLHQACNTQNVMLQKRRQELCLSVFSCLFHLVQAQLQTNFICLFFLDMVVLEIHFL